MTSLIESVLDLQFLTYSVHIVSIVVHVLQVGVVRALDWYKASLSLSETSWMHINRICAVPLSWCTYVPLTTYGSEWLLLFWSGYCFPSLCISPYLYKSGSDCPCRLLVLVVYIYIVAFAIGENFSGSMLVRCCFSVLYCKDAEVSCILLWMNACIMVVTIPALVVPALAAKVTSVPACVQQLTLSVTASFVSCS